MANQFISNELYLLKLYTYKNVLNDYFIFPSVKPFFLILSLVCSYQRAPLTSILYSTIEQD